MLQPRERVPHTTIMRTTVTKSGSITKWSHIYRPFVAILLSVLLQLSHAQSYDDAYTVEPTPALEVGKEALTTVLLLNKDNGRNDFLGRYVNLKPEVGLLTSTARTFIQEGVTTEYATQVLGTTLENGRVYAQYLKKSSRVLFENMPSYSVSVVTSWVGESTSSVKIMPEHINNFLLPEHQDLYNTDNRSTIQHNEFVGNTDFVGINNKKKYATVNLFESSKINIDATKVANEIQSFNSVENNWKQTDETTSNDIRKLIVNKVLPIANLPTYTIINKFEPSGYSSSNNSDEFLRADQEQKFSVQTGDENRSPKLYFQQVINSIDTNLSAVPQVQLKRSFSTTTYYGFAEFVTTVGDSVIVFSPSKTTENANMGHITSISGEATLGDRFEEFVPSVVINTISPTYDTFTLIQTKSPNDDIRPQTETVKEFITENIELQNKQKKIEEDTTTVSSNSNLDDILLQELGLQSSSPLDSSEVPSSEIGKNLQSIPNDIKTHMYSRPSEQEILEIYASLSREANKKLTPIPTEGYEIVTSSNSKQTIKEKDVASGIEVHGGATTIFFEDDPLSNFIEPTAILKPTPSSSKMDILQSSSSSSTNEYSILSTEYEVKTANITQDNTNADTSTPNGIEKQIISTECKNSQVGCSEDFSEIATTTDDVSFDTTENPTEKQFDPYVTDADNSTKPEVKSSAVILHNFIIEEINEKDNKINEPCIRTSQVFLTQVPKTVTLYPTQLTTVTDSDGLETITSTVTETNVVSSFDITQATKHYCIKPTSASFNGNTMSIQLEKPPENNLSSEAKEEISFNKGNNLQEDILSTTESFETDERDNESEFITDTTENIKTDKNLKQNPTVKNIEENTTDENTQLAASDEEESYPVESENSDESSEEIELLYRTLYITYTYLTTFYHEKTTSISSHTEVVTNVITSTLEVENDSQQNTEVVSLASKIYPTTPQNSVEQLSTTKTFSKFMVPSEVENFVREEDNISSEKNVISTNILNEENHKIKTYYTTYTYYTTIFVEGDTEVMSRTEVYTNLITSSLVIEPTKTFDNLVETATSDKFVPKEYDNISENLILDTIIQKSSDIVEKQTSSQLQYSTMLRHLSSPIELQDYDITLMTDIRYSSSNGAKQIINNPLALPKRNDTIDDQIISESNTDEIVPSATLLLQTSFTTFTYYTTMYSGTSSNVMSHLETVTSVATETLTPSKMITFDEEGVSQPVTYFTTFTYWTKLTKYGDVTTISREETITNFATPATIAPTLTNEITQELRTDFLNENSDLKIENKIEATPLLPENSITSIPVDINVNKLEPTTYYTTYTFYTTSYEANKTFTDSRFETITNVVTPTLTLPNISLAPEKDIKGDEKENKINVETSAVDKLNFILYDYKKIIDAEGVSTLFLTTQIIPSVAEDGQTTEFLTSTSSLYVDEVKKALLQTTATVSTEENTEGSASRTYKTGLVRLIEGTKIANSTTTLYQSKVIGTVIDNRYAQIIESTSSFLYETTKVQQQQSALTPTPTLDQNTIGTTQQAVLSSENYFETTESNIESSDENIDEKDLQQNSGLSKKRTFTPVIRPFASRNRPLFAPKKNNLLPSSATIITRSDFTPTITATPALKSTNNRFGSTRKSSPINTAIFNPNSSRRFSRPSKSSNSGSQLYTSATSSVNFGGIRNRLSSSTQLSSLSGGRRSSSLLRPTSGGSYRPAFSSVYAGNSRLRIKSTSIFSGANTLATQKPESDTSEEEVSTKETPNNDDDDNGQTVSSNKIKQNNSLLRFRRPLSRPSGFTLNNRSISNNAISSRKNPVSGRSKELTTTTSTTISTTAKPAQPRAFQRPGVVNFQNRPRAQSSLFPPRGLFQAVQSKSTPLEEPNTEKKANEETDGEDDSEYEDDEDGDGEADSLDDDGNRRRRSNSKQVQKLKNSNLLSKNINDKLLKTVKSRSGKKRQRRSAENNFSNRGNLRTNFRRGRPITSNESPSYNTDDTGPVTPVSTTTTTRSRLSSRFGARYQIFNMQHPTTTAVTTPANNRAIRPTRPSIGRTQFTLREKDTTTTTQKGLSRTATTSAFRRPKTSTVSARRTTHSSPNNRRLKNYSTNSVPLDNSRTTISRNRNTSNQRGRGMTTVRSRSRNEFIEPIFDGIITITHVVPAEATIPVVNGKITEYKNIITAKTSTEIVSSQQYTRYVGNNGQTTLALVHEESSTNLAGATEVTQFILHETPTTSVTFTPTTIRGRKTSFSHIIPSTIYSVENVVSTLQPQISANAPLANILLSQLLLGNIGLPSNPLLEALGGAITPSMQVPAVSNLAAPVPVTEFRTHTSTYVTTLYGGMSTVLPVTFQGKKILTTVFDTTAETITATEFITDTIVTTPTLQQQPAAQVNSLLLQQLLLQQQPQPQVEQISQNSILPKQVFFNENLQDIDTNNVRVSSENDDIDDQIPILEETVTHKTGRKKLRKSGKGQKRNKQQKQLEEDQNSSVITLYVSGRRPGEFSTILSTVKAGYESTLHKREADTSIQATTSIENTEDFYNGDGSEIINNYALPDSIESVLEVQQPAANNEDTDLILAFNSIESNDSFQQQTQSLESIVGDVILWHAKTTQNLSEMTKINPVEAIPTMHSTNVKHFQKNERSNIHFLE